jgi:putative ABC transport system permease protein
MIGNYIKLAIRHLARNKFYALINILGLSVGFVCAIFILLYVDDELTYDKHHEKHEHIYRLDSVYRIESGTVKTAVCSVPLGVTMKDEYPQISEVVRFLPVGREFFKYNEKDFLEEDFYYTDPTVFNVFTHRFLIGSATDALKLPHAMVMTESLAEKYFGDENPIGKAILNRQGRSLKVVGVIEDLPGNSHLKFDALISMATHAEERGRAHFDSRSADRFAGAHMFTYVLLNSESTINSVIEDFDWFREKYFSGAANDLVDSLYLDATLLAETHFRSGIFNDKPHGNIAFVYMLAILALFLLIISSINYLNMATAWASKRRKEVGLRKVMGAFKGQLIKQFLVESILFSLLAFLFSIVLAELFFPSFKQISGKDLMLLTYSNTNLIALALLMSIIVGLGSGCYPAFYLSRFMPYAVLGHSAASLRRNSFLRNALVVVQFSISITMIIATLVVFKQANYMKNKDLGFDKEDIIVQRVGARGESIQTSIDVLKQELKRSPFILDTAASTGSLGGDITGVPLLVEVDGRMQEMLMCVLAADYNYLDLMGIEVKEGRTFERDMITDRKHAYIINEATARQAGWRKDAIGKKIQFDTNFDGRLDGPSDIDGRVIGIVEDFHIEGLQNEIDPCVILILDTSMPADSITIKTQPGKTAEALRFIEQKTRELNANTPPDYFFLERELAEYYHSEERLVNILGSFSILSILISCMGLLGLSSFVTEQRTKEIGIRRVVGAKISSIIFLLSKDFLILVLIANIVAWPIAAFVMSKWLENFAFRIEIGLSTFVLAALAAFLIAFLTVGFQAFKAASANPIKALRYE